MSEVGIHAFSVEDGHVQVWATLPKGPVVAFRWCPGQSDIVDKATEIYSDSLARAIELAVIENQPVVPDAPPTGVILPCRMCGATRPDNLEDGRGFTWCREHREYARDG